MPLQDLRSGLGHCHLILKNPVRLIASVRCQLIDRDDLVGGITILIKGLMAGDPIIGNVLNRVDHRLTEHLGTSSIARILRRVSTVGKSGLDCLYQDICTVIRSRAVNVDGTVDSTILLDEYLCRGILTFINNDITAYVDAGR